MKRNVKILLFLCFNDDSLWSYNRQCIFQTINSPTWLWLSPHKYTCQSQEFSKSYLHHLLIVFVIGHFPRVVVAATNFIFQTNENTLESSPGLKSPYNIIKTELEANLFYILMYFCRLSERRYVNSGLKKQASNFSVPSGMCFVLLLLAIWSV